MQSRLQRYTGKRALALLAHPRFRAAYDFLCLRAQAGEDVRACAEWWTGIQEKNPDERRQMVEAMSAPRPGQRRRRSRRRRPGKRHDTHSA
jgi:poly(A) polymerase